MNLQNFKENLFIVMGSISVFITILIVVILAVGLTTWWAYEPMKNPISIPHPSEQGAAYIGKKRIMVKQEFVILQKIDLTVQHEMIRSKPDGTVITIDLPSISASYEPGTYKTERLLDLPSSIFGRFELRSRLCWHTNPLKIACVYLPTTVINIDADK